MKNLPLQSANFKRDYVATLAIVLFALIVIAEVTLAIAIPAYLHRENSMALEARRVRMKENFDYARNRCNGKNPGDKNKLSPKTTAAAMELQLVSWNLDRLAPYLRSPGDKNLSSEEIARIQEVINQSHHVMNVIGSGKSFSKETEINTDIYINSLIPKDGGK